MTTDADVTPSDRVRLVTGASSDSAERSAGQRRTKTHFELLMDEVFTSQVEGRRVRRDGRHNGATSGG